MYIALSGQRLALKAELNVIRDDTKYIRDAVDEFKARNYIESTTLNPIKGYIKALNTYQILYNERNIYYGDFKIERAQKLFGKIY